MSNLESLITVGYWINDTIFFKLTTYFVFRESVNKPIYDIKNI